MGGGSGDDDAGDADDDDDIDDADQRRTISSMMWEVWFPKCCNDQLDPFIETTPQVQVAPLVYPCKPWSMKARVHAD